MQPKHIKDAVLGEIQAIRRQNNKRFKKINAMLGPDGDGRREKSGQASGTGSATLPDLKPLIRQAEKLDRAVEGLDSHVMNTLADVRAFAGDVAEILRELSELGSGKRVN